MFPGRDQQPIRIQTESIIAIECKCGSNTFTRKLKFGCLPATLSPSGDRILIPIEIFQCIDCEKFYEQDELLDQVP